MKALSPQTVKRIRELRYMDGLTAPATAALVGCSRCAVYRHAPGLPGRVPNGPAREVFLASGKSAASVAAEVGWMSKQACRNGTFKIAGDGSRLRRSLGITPDINKGTLTKRRLLDAEIAGLIAEACGQPAWSVMPDEDKQMAA
jgi:hypothetical protein